MGSVDPPLAGRCAFFPLGRLGPKTFDEYCSFSDESDFVRLRLQAFLFLFFSMLQLAAWPFLLSFPRLFLSFVASTCATKRKNSSNIRFPLKELQ